MKVDFVIAGAQKGGTSALDAYLREHPGICMAGKKEVHFFDNERYFKTAHPDYAVYHAHFPAVPPRPGLLYGEATPIYMYWRSAPARIQRYNPGMKLVISLRNPIERAFSQWNMQRERGKDPLPFRQALQQEPERCRASLPLQNRLFSYVDRGFYSEQLQRVWACFPRSQTLVLRSDQVKSDPERALGSICRFLQVPPLQNVRNRTVHARPYAAPMDPADWQYLRGVFEGEIRALEKLLGWDCSDWLQMPAGHSCSP
jgi:hypothetical protein